MPSLPPNEQRQSTEGRALPTIALRTVTELETGGAARVKWPVVVGDAALLGVAGSDGGWLSPRFLVCRRQ